MINNSFQFIGRLTKEPAYYGGNDSKKSFVVFDLAVEKNNDEVEYVHLNAFGKTADIVNQYVTKGTLIIVNGKINFTREAEINTTSGTTKIIIPEFVVDEMRILSKPQQNQSTENQGA